MARFENGWIKLHRQILSGDLSEADNFTLGLWARILLMANRLNGTALFTGNQIEIAPGQLITGLEELAGKRGDPYFHRTRRALQYLEKTGRIAQTTSKHGRLISVRNWEEYQSPENQERSQRADDAQTTSKQTANDAQFNGEVQEDKKNTYILDFESALTEYKHLPGVQKGSKAEKRFQDQVKSEADLDRLIVAIQNYRTFLSWPENEWRRPKTTFETFLGSKASGFFWHDYVELPARGSSGAAPRAEMDF